MAGIVGLIGTAPFLDKNPAILDEMSAILNTQEFYQTGKYLDSKEGIKIGWKDLNIFSNSGLPFWNKKKDIALILIGECYGDNYDKYNISSKDDNNKFNHLDHLLSLYEENGIDFLKNINGWFCGVLIDFRSNEIQLFNDPFGIKRIYYHHSREAFYFSSEAKSLLKVLPELRSINYDGLGEYFSLGCTLGDKTFFKNISIFPAGSVWTFSSGRLTKKYRYLEHDFRPEKKTLDKVSVYNNLKDILLPIMSRYYKANEHVAISLTGGLDTRLIMAWSEFPPYKVPCYTFSGPYRDCYDAKIAAKIATLCQQHHEIIRLTRKYFSEFPALAKKVIMYTDGTMDVSGTAELFVLRQAKEIAPIRLTGNYGDQVLRGLVGFQQKPLDNSIFDSKFLFSINNGFESYRQLKSERYLDFFISYQLPYYHYSRLCLEQAQLLMRTPFLDRDLLNIIFSLKQGDSFDVPLTLKLIYDGNPDLAKLTTDRGNRYPSIPVITPSKRAVKEFLYKAEYAFDYGMPNWLAKIDNSLKNLNMQKGFLGRQKYYHFRTWYKNELSDYVKEMLLSPRSLSRPYLKKECFKKIIRSHMDGKGNYTREIHSVLSCELLHRYLIESI